jgi:hypothetical protein
MADEPTDPPIVEYKPAPGDHLTFEILGESLTFTVQGIEDRRDQGYWALFSEGSGSIP